MKSLRGIFAIAAVLAAPMAYAADMPVKAPALSFNYYSDGWYVGIDGGGGVAKGSANGDLFGTALLSSSLTAAGGDVGGCAGYVRGNAVQWWGFHTCVDYQNVTGSVPTNALVPVSASMLSRWSASQEIRFGGTLNPLQLALNAFSNLGFSGISFPTFAPVAPVGVNVAATPRAYMAAGVEEFGVSGSFNVGPLGSSTGASIGIGPMVKAGFIWQALNTAGQPTGGAIDTYVKVVWPERGLTLNNILAPSGAPMIGGAVDMGTQYYAGISYLFGVPTYR